MVVQGKHVANLKVLCCCNLNHTNTYKYIQWVKLENSMIENSKIDHCNAVNDMCDTITCGNTMTNIQRVCFDIRHL